MRTLTLRLRRFRPRPKSLEELADEMPDKGDRREIERLNAYNYGCWDRGCDQGAGLPGGRVPGQNARP